MTPLRRDENCRRRACGRTLVLAYVGCITLGLASCGNSKPGGEVVATVNGREITAQDLDAEARANGLPNAGRSRAALLRRVIDRTLFAQSAHDQKLDAYPSYPSDRVRLEQSALADKALQKVTQIQTQASENEVMAFMKVHPFAFADRQKVKLDQIVLNESPPPTVKSLGTLDMIGVFYKRLGLPFQRTSTVIDTLSLNAPTAEEITSMPLGKVFIIARGDQNIANAVAARQPLRLTAGDQKALATAMMQHERTLERIRAENHRLYARSKIVYASGYAPK